MEKRRAGIVSWIVLLCFYLLTGLPVSAQTDSLKAASTDNSRIVLRYPAEKHLEEFRNNRDYQYHDTSPPENPAGKWISWILRKISDFFSGKSYESFWQYALLALAAGLVVFLLYKTKILDYVFPSQSARISGDYVIGQENIHEINFEEAIDNALAVRDFRLAIRLQYLKILKQLSTRELIHWKPNLTNQNYVLELSKYPFQADFIKITRYFEFAWYGDFQIGESEFEEMKDFSTVFQNKISG